MSSAGFLDRDSIAKLGFEITPEEVLVERKVEIVEAIIPSSTVLR